MNERKLKPGTIFFFHYAKWSPVGVLLVLTGLEKYSKNIRWYFRKLDGQECVTSVYIDDSARRDITIVGQLPPDELDATVFIPSYKIVPRTHRLVKLLKKLW